MERVKSLSEEPFKEAIVSILQKCIGANQQADFWLQLEQVLNGNTLVMYMTNCD